MSRAAKTVLCASDLSPTGDGAVAVAFALAARAGTVHLLHVNVPAVVLSPLDATIIHASPPDPEEVEKLEREVGEHMKKLVPSDASSRRVRFEVHVLQEPTPAEAIVREAERLGADLIVLGTHGRTGLKKALLGSVASSVMKSAKTPVVLVRGAP